MWFIGSWFHDQGLNLCLSAVKAPSSNHWIAREFPIGSGLEVGTGSGMWGRKQGRTDEHVGLPGSPSGASKGPKGSSRLEHISEFPPQGVRGPDPHMTCQSVPRCWSPRRVVTLRWKACGLKAGGCDLSAAILAGTVGGCTPPSNLERRSFIPAGDTLEYPLHTLPPPPSCETFISENQGTALS